MLLRTEVDSYAVALTSGGGPTPIASGSGSGRNILHNRSSYSYAGDHAPRFISTLVALSGSLDSRPRQDSGGHVSHQQSSRSDRSRVPQQILAFCRNSNSFNAARRGERSFCSNCADDAFGCKGGWGTSLYQLQAARRHIAGFGRKILGKFSFLSG